MKFSSLKPFVPSGKDFDLSRQFFIELGFSINWESSDYIDFERDGCAFILQRFDNVEFAKQYMLTVGIEDVEKFRNFLLEKKTQERYGIQISKVTFQSYGKEVNIIDCAGVCWHFVEQF